MFVPFQCKKVKKDVCSSEDCPIRLLPEICRMEKKKVNKLFFSFLFLPKSALSLSTTPHPTGGKGGSI